MGQLKKGVFLSYITVILTNVVGLLLTPFIVKSIGDAEYGLYLLIGSIVGYISLLDFGLGNTIVRFVAKYRAEKDKIGEEKFLAITMTIYGVIALIILITGIVLYSRLDVIFTSSLSVEELAKAKVMFIILIFNLAVTLPGGAFTGIASGYEHFVFPRSINIIRYLVRSLMVVGLLLMGGDSIGIVVLDTVMNIIVIALNGWYVIRKLKVSFKFHSIEFTLVKQIFSYSIWIFVLVIITQLQWQSGQVIIGMNLNTTQVGIYGIGVLLGGYYGAFSGAISGVFLPRATEMVFTNASTSELSNMMIKIGRISLLTLLLIIGGFTLYGRQFVKLWVGDTYSDSWLIALIIMIGYTVPLIQTFAQSILQARSLFVFKVIVYFVFISSGILIGKVLLSSYGIVSLAASTTSGWLVAQLLMNIYFMRKLDLKMLLFFKMMFYKIIPTFILIMAIGYLIYIIPGFSWSNLLLKISLFSLVYFTLMYAWGMDNSEKQLVLNVLNSKKANQK